MITIIIIVIIKKKCFLLSIISESIEIWKVGFCGRRETLRPREKPSKSGKQSTTNSNQPKIYWLCRACSFA